jgi:hypothetical protein
MTPRPIRSLVVNSELPAITLFALSMTVLRSLKPLRQAGILAVALVFGLPPSFLQAQTAPATAVGQVRNFPPKTQLGELIVGTFPEASINGKPARFSASGRLLNESNLIVTPSSVYNRTILVRYELDFEGFINRAWLLNQAELKQAQEESRSTR